MTNGLDPDDTLAAFDARPPTPADAAPATLGRGATVDRYVVLSRLGAGAMGVVYAAYDPELDRKVALKLLLPSRRGGADAPARLQREAQALAKLSHPNVVAVHDVGLVDDRVYVAMEFVDGRTVTDWLAEGKRSWREVVEVFVAASRNNLATVLKAQGKYAEAESEHRAALALLLEALGEDHPDVATLRNNLANVLHAQGKYAEGEAKHRAALALRLEALGENHPHVAASRKNLAQTLLAQGEHEEALSLLRAAWAVHERAPLPPAQAAETAFALAQALWAADTDRDRARALARQAADLYRQTKPPDTDALHEVQQWLHEHGGDP